MCGRYGFTLTDKELTDRFDIEVFNFELRDSYNVAPTQEMPVVERHSPNSLHLRKWGIQPGWSKMFIINATTEKLTTSRFWSKPFTESRCIIPASFFYEWKMLGKDKQPYLIRLKSKEAMGFAGLLLNYRDKENQEQTGYVIITTRPNDLMSGIHKRMPAILNRDDEDEWLNPDNVDPEKLLPMLDPYPTDLMEAYPVSTHVNIPKNNYPEITQQVDPLIHE